MANHKWKVLKLEVEAYICEKCGCEKYAISTNFGGWDYAMPGQVLGANQSFYSLKRPECKELNKKQMLTNNNQ